MKYGSASHREVVFFPSCYFQCKQCTTTTATQKKKKLYIDLNVILIRVSGIGFVPFHIRLYEVHVHTYIFCCLFIFLLLLFKFCSSVPFLSHSETVMPAFQMFSFCDKNRTGLWQNRDGPSSIVCIEMSKSVHFNMF